MRTDKKRKEGSTDRTRLLLDWSLYELHSACMRNAVELKEEAELLLLAKRYARAVALAITAREELGKAQIVADRIHSSVSRQEFEDAFRRHDLKSAYVSRVVNLETSEGSRGLITGGTITYDLQKGKEIFELRCDSLYVSWDGSKPVTPQEKITPELAAKIVGAAKKSVENEVHTQYITERIGTQAQFE